MPLSPTALRILALLFVGALLVFGSTAPHLPALVPAGLRLDLAAHGSAHAALAALAPLAPAPAAAVSAAAALAVEALQGSRFVAARSFAWDDFVAGCIGACLAGGGRLLAARRRGEGQVLPL